MIGGAIFTFDETAETAMRGLWQQIADTGLSPVMAGLDYPPHMTITLFKDLDWAAMRVAMRQLAERQPASPLEITFPSLGIFRGKESVVFLAPTVNQDLLALHQAAWQTVIQCVSGAADLDTPGLWVPHVTLAIHIPQDRLAAVVNLLSAAPLPRTATITGMMYGFFDEQGGSQLEQVSFH